MTADDIREWTSQAALSRHERAWINSLADVMESAQLQRLLQPTALSQELKDAIDRTVALPR